MSAAPTGDVNGRAVNQFVLNPLVISLKVIMLDILGNAGMQVDNLAIAGKMSYIMNPATVEETVVETGGISAGSEASGIRMNLVPKEAGNSFKFGADTTYMNRHMQSDNLSDTLRERAARYGVTLSTVHMWRRRGLLRAHPVTDKGQYLYEIPPDDLPAKFAHKGTYEPESVPSISRSQRGAV